MNRVVSEASASGAVEAALDQLSPETGRLLTMLAEGPPYSEAFQSKVVEVTGLADQDLAEFYGRWYQVSTGQAGRPLCLAPVRAGTLNRVAEAWTITWPKARSIAGPIPTGIQRRSGVTITAPAVQEFDSDDPLHLSFNHGIPVVTWGTARNEVVRELSSPLFGLLNLKGGATAIALDTVELRNVCLIHDRFGGNNYAHWLLDWLPRFKFLLQAGRWDRGTKIVLPMSANGSQKDSFRALGIDEDQIISLRRETLRHGVVFALRGAFGCSTSGPDLRRPAQFCAPWALDFVRSTFLGSTAPARRRILISRKGTRQLRLSEAAQSLFTRWGFEEVFLEGESVADQAALFNSAEIVVAAHGAGLSNLVFCEPGTHVLEIFPENYSTGNFFSVSSALGLNYVSAIGKTVKVEGAKHIRDHDIEVPGQIVQDFLELC